MKKILCLAITMLIAVSAAWAASPKVYSNCYDGYLNLRLKPTSKSQIVGKLPNGPEGAELLGVEGKWSKVRVNGVVGYVFSSYLQSKPTEPVYIKASAVVGEWGCFHSYHTAIYTIKDNGKFTYQCQQGGDTSGSWYLSRDKLVLKYANGRTVTCEVTDSYLIIGDFAYDRY